MKFLVSIFCIIFSTEIFCQKLNYSLYISGGPRYTQLKGYEKYLGEKFIKSVPSFGFKYDVGICSKYKKIFFDASLGFKKSKSNFITVTEPYGGLAQFEENLLRLDLIIYKYTSNFSIGYQINKSNAFIASLFQSLDTYFRGTIINDESLEYPNSNPGDQGAIFSNFDLDTKRAETMLEVGWIYQYTKNWQLSLTGSTSLYPYHLTYWTFPSKGIYIQWDLPIKENAIDLKFIYTFHKSKKNEQ